MRRRCSHVQERLPRHIDGELPRWRARLIDRHIRSCHECTVELARQQEVQAGLDAIGSAAEGSLPPAPDDLLETLLGQVQEPGVRGRAAIPMRGAVSGARPGLSVAFGLALATLVGLAAVVGWRLGRAWSSRR